MSIELLYIIAFLLPLVLTPVLLPVFVLFAHRKHITEGPGERRRQEKPIAVTGGSVIMLATNSILLGNILVIAIWFVTAKTGMPVIPQLLVTLFAGVIVFWLPYFIIENLRDRRADRFEAMTASCSRISARVDTFVDRIGNIIDGKRPAHNSSPSYPSVTP